jgi:hypothetical protein
VAPSSIWALKPWWCQPWSIVLTGIAVVAASLFWPGRLWFSLLLAAGVVAWWLLFLVLVPAAWKREQAEALLPESAQR